MSDVLTLSAEARDRLAREPPALSAVRAAYPPSSYETTREPTWFTSRKSF